MSDDSIRRSDAIKALCDGCGWKVQCDQDEGFWCESGELIRRDIPSADRPQGEWLDEDSYYYWRCSNCNEQSCCRSKFCGNCGARMKGADDEN